MSATLLPLTLHHREGQEDDPPDLADQSGLGNALGNVNQGKNQQLDLTEIFLKFIVSLR